MARTTTAIIAFLLLGLTLGNAFSMPLRNDVVEKFRADGRLEEHKALMDAAYARGVNNPGSFAAPHLLESDGPGRIMVATSRQAIVIIAEFSDNPADTVMYPASHYQDLLFSIGTYPTGSMRDYYLENSFGDFEVTGEIAGWLMMPQTYAYYVNGQTGFGSYPRNAQKLTEDAVIAADPYVDFSQYDNDGPDGIPDSGDDDGYVDALFVVHAGPGYETSGNSNDIWSHAWATSYDVPVDGVFVSGYSHEPEDGHIGVFCHEFGHVLGLPDLYDYGYDSRGAGYWSVMAGGSWGGGGITPVHFDAWSKSKLGFVTPIVPTTNLIDVEIHPVEDSSVVYQLWIDGVPGKQYFMVEHRRKIRHDTAIRGEGVIIYHCDDKQDGNDFQQCGPGVPHYLVAVEQADGECELENNTSSGDVGDPWPGSGGTHNPNHAFNRLSTPNTNGYADGVTNVSVYNIRNEGTRAFISMAVAPVSPYVEVMSPNGGGSYDEGDPLTITWVAFDDIVVDSVSILLSRDGGATFPGLIASGLANDSSHVWDVEGPGASDCRIKVVAHDNDGGASEDESDSGFEIVADLSGIAGNSQVEFGIVSIDPNPTVSGTRIKFAAPAQGVDARIYDVAGRVVAHLSPVASSQSQGIYEADWDGRNINGHMMAPGVYFVRVSSGQKATTARIMISR